MSIKSKIIFKIKQIAYRVAYGTKTTSGTYVAHLRSIGMKIGENTTFYDPKTTMIDETRPWLVEIGNDVQITAGVTLLTHGADGMVIENKYGYFPGSSGKVKIGDNCFIGMNTTILKGVTIGNNVVIGANSLVNKDIPDNCVAAGNPANSLKTIDEHLSQRTQCQVEEAKELAIAYLERTGTTPPEFILREFFWLFAPRNEESLNTYESYFTQVSNSESVIKNFLSSEPKFNGYNDMLETFGIQQR